MLSSKQNAVQCHKVANRMQFNASISVEVELHAVLSRADWFL